MHLPEVLQQVVVSPETLVSNSVAETALSHLRAVNLFGGEMRFKVAVEVETSTERLLAMRVDANERLLI